MIRIFFKTIWNNRKRNILVIIELFIISLVLVNLVVFLTNMIWIGNIRNCYDSRDVVYLVFAPLQQEDPAKSKQEFANLKTKLQSNLYVESVSFSTNSVPYNFSMSSSGYKSGNDQINLVIRNVDINYAGVMKIKPLKGRWFDETDLGKAVRPIILTKSVEKKYYHGDAIGKQLGDETKFEVIGVVDEFKRSDIEKPYLTGFFFFDDQKNQSWWIDILVRVKDGQVENFLKTAESESMSVMDPKYWTISTQNSLENLHTVQKDDSARQRQIGLMVAFFIMINVLLGVIGILWYNTNLRIHEIGIKRALGSTGKKIKSQLILENMFLGGLGLIVVSLVFIQVPSIRLTRVDPPAMYLSVLISVFVMILLILLSTWIPASIASKIRPAEALKTE